MKSQNSPTDLYVNGSSDSFYPNIDIDNINTIMIALILTIIILGDNGALKCLDSN